MGARVSVRKPVPLGPFISSQVQHSAKCVSQTVTTVSPAPSSGRQGRFPDDSVSLQMAEGGKEGGMERALAHKRAARREYV